MGLHQMPDDGEGSGLGYRKVPGFVVFHEHREQVDQLLLRRSNLGLPSQFLQLLDIELMLLVSGDGFRLGLSEKLSIVNRDGAHFFQAPVLYSLCGIKCFTKIICQRYSILTINLYALPLMLKTVYGSTKS